MEHAEATGDASFLAALKGAYTQGDVNLEGYRQAHRDHRLEKYWDAFTQEAQKVLEDPTPSRPLGSKSLWSDIVAVTRRNI